MARLSPSTLLLTALCAACAPPPPAVSRPEPLASPESLPPLGPPPSPAAPPPPGPTQQVAAPAPRGAACLSEIAPAKRQLRTPTLPWSSPCAKEDAADCRARCDKGSERACKILADLYFQGKGVASDASIAQTYWERSCRMGDLVGCTSAGVYYMQSDGACADALFKLSCDHGDAQGCEMLKQHAR